MWYKIAKYGTLWDRLGPESEQEIDRILDESTVREKIIDPETKTEKEIRKIDFIKLDQLLKKSVLGEKGVLNKIVEEAIDPKTGGYFSHNRDTVPFIKTKIFNIPITIRRNMNKVIKVNSQYTTGFYIWLRGLIKHEISHAISAAFLPISRHREGEVEKELYLPPYFLSKQDVRETFRETNLFSKFKKIKELIFLDKLPSFEKFLSEQLGPNFIKEYLIENLDESTLPQRAETINRLFDSFNWKRNIAGLYDKRVHEAGKDEIREVEKIQENFYTGNHGKPSKEYHEWLETHNDELEKRSKLLIPGGDLYYANPEETRSHLAQYKEYFNLSSVKEYYNLQNYTTPKEQHIPDFLNLIKTIFNEAVIYGESGNFYHISNYFDTLNLGDFLRSELYIKRFDQKFQRQLAKILNENYQQIKEYFNNMLQQKEGE